MAGAAVLPEGWASGRHGALRESSDSWHSVAAVDLGGPVGPREAKRRAHHHGRELERAAGGRVDDRIVSAGRLFWVPWVDRSPRSRPGPPLPPDSLMPVRSSPGLAAVPISCWLGRTPCSFLSRER